MKLRCIIIDDSPLQQLIIAKLANEDARLKISGIYSCPLEAYPHIKDGNIDLIFLDIEMPLFSGFDLLESLENPPQTILISKKSDYALKAFDYDITHYLLKPINPKCFNKSVERAIMQYEIRQPDKKDNEYIFVKSNLKSVKVFVKSIKWIEALGDYIKVVTEGRNIIVLSTMKSFEKMVPKDRFLRIHKSFIVNLDRIEVFNHKNIEVDGDLLPLSRNRKEKFLDTMTHYKINLKNAS